MNYYHSVRKTTDNNVKQPKNHTKWRIPSLDYVRNLLILFIIIILLLVSMVVNRKPSVTVNSQIYHTSNVYAAAIDTRFAKLKNRNKITLNQASLARSIESQFPEVEGVDINLPIYARTASVKLKIASPSFTLNGVSTTGKRGTYIVASDGKAVGPASDYPKIKGLPSIIDKSNYPVKIGQLVLGKGTSSFILSIIAQCKKYNVPVASFDLAANSQEIDLHTEDKKYYVKFDLMSDPATQIGQFLAARAQLAKTGDPSQYLDVRVSGRIYYK